MTKDIIIAEGGAMAEGIGDGVKIAAVVTLGIVGHRGDCLLTAARD